MTGITRRKNLNPARRNRTYPRAVKRWTRTAYPTRKPGDTGTRHHSPPAISLTAPATPSTSPPAQTKIKIS